MNDDKTTEAYCKICYLPGIEKSSIETITYNGQQMDVEVAYNFCVPCNREFIPTHMILENEQRIREAKEDFRANPYVIDESVPSIETLIVGNPNGNNLVISNDGVELISINLDSGETTLSEDYTPDVAGKIFWKAVALTFPGKFNETK